MTDLLELAHLEPHFWRAPSAHNTQPWLLTYAPDRVELRYDPGRALPVGDPTQRDLLLSLGAFVEGVLIAASSTGTPLEFEPEVDSDGNLIGHFVAAKAPYATTFTLADLAQRQTSRLSYRPERLHADELAEARSAIAPGAELHEVATRNLVDLVRTADRHLYESPEVVAELRTWLRLSRRHPRYEQDGLSYDCLALGRLEATAADVLLHPAIYPLVRRLRLHRSAAQLGFTLTGAVPDVRPFVAHSAVAVAPLRVAQGVPNKILEAMAMAKAVVATPAGVAGLRVRAGQDIILAADSDAFARAVIRALDPQYARVLGAHARARVLADYDWATSLRILDRLVAPAPLTRRRWRPSADGPPTRLLPGEP